jgi:hypothetical protein
MPEYVQYGDAGMDDLGTVTARLDHLSNYWPVNNHEVE